MEQPHRHSRWGKGELKQSKQSTWPFFKAKWLHHFLCRIPPPFSSHCLLRFEQRERAIFRWASARHHHLLYFCGLANTVLLLLLLLYIANTTMLACLFACLPMQCDASVAFRWGKPFMASAWRMHAILLFAPFKWNPRELFPCALDRSFGSIRALMVRIQEDGWDLALPKH